MSPALVWTLIIIYNYVASYYLELQKLLFPRAMINGIATQLPTHARWRLNVKRSISEMIQNNETPSVFTSVFVEEVWLSDLHSGFHLQRKATRGGSKPPFAYSDYLLALCLICLQKLFI